MKSLLAPRPTLCTGKKFRSLAAGLLVCPFFVKSTKREKSRRKKREREKEKNHFSSFAERREGATFYLFIPQVLSFSPVPLSWCERRTLSTAHREKRAEKRERMEPEGEGGEGAAPPPAASASILDADAAAPDADDPPRSESLGTADTSSGSGTSDSFSLFAASQRASNALEG